MLRSTPAGVCGRASVLACEEAAACRRRLLVCCFGAVIVSGMVMPASPRLVLPRAYLAEAGVHPLYYDTKYFRILFHHHCFAGINYSLSMFNEKY